MDVFLNVIDVDVKREVQELRAEVRRLRCTVETGLVAIGLAAVVIFPQFLMLALVIGVLVLFAFLVSRQRRMIFGSIFDKPDSDDPDA